MNKNYQKNMPMTNIASILEASKRHFEKSLYDPKGKSSEYPNDD
jgi:hypothetical protein